MEVILKNDVKSLGQVGDVVRVKEGYARNFLFPQQLAVPATNANLQQLERQKKVIEAQRAQAKTEAQGKAAKLEALSCTITKKVGEEGKLFGSVTAAEVAEALSAQGFPIEKKVIDLPGPVKALGEYTAKISLHPEVTAEVKVHVVADTEV